MSESRGITYPDGQRLVVHVPDGCPESDTLSGFFETQEAFEQALISLTERANGGE